MSRFWSPLVHGLTPYVPGEQPRVGNLVKLNTNENPYGPSPRVLEALRVEVGDSLRLYPDPDSGHLRDVIAKRHQVGANNVFVGNGSDEVLAFVFLALLKHDKPLLFPDITYSFYPVYCRLFGIQFIEIALNDAFAIDLDNYHVANGGIIFPNPNAPTGHLLKIPDIDALLRTNTSSVVVIDEAYVEFGGQSAVALSLRYPNLLVTRTLSKSDALAGLRVGYAVGHAELVAALTRVKDSFNSFPLDRFAQAGAAAAIQDQAYGREICDRVIASRQRLVAALEALDFQVLPSAANFVLARHPRHMGADLAGRLRERGVLVRNFRQPQRIASFLRITVGTDAQCDALLAALRGLV